MALDYLRLLATLLEPVASLCPHHFLPSGGQELYVVGNFLPGPNVAGKVITLPDCQGACGLRWQLGQKLE